MSSGWIAVHRKMTEWEWYSDANTFRLFIHLLISANHKDNKWRGIDVKKGSLVTGRTKLAEALGLSVQQIRTSLDRLKSTNEITIKTTNKFSIISITNWALYQDKEVPVTSKPTNQQPTNNHQSTTNNNENNENNENKQIKQTPLAMLTDMNVDQAIATEWLKVRKTKRLAATQTAFTAAKKQADIAGIDFNDAIKMCVEESWGGFKADWLKSNKNRNSNVFRGDQKRDYTQGTEGFVQ